MSELLPVTTPIALVTKNRIINIIKEEIGILSIGKAK
jgi:hypothetical protein